MSRCDSSWQLHRCIFHVRSWDIVCNGIRFNTPALNSTCEIVSKTCSDFFLSTRFPCLFSHMRAPLCCIMSLAQSQCGS